MARAGCVFAVGLLLSISLPAQNLPEPAHVPISGKAAPGFEEFERGVVDVVERDHIPGVAIAFVKDGRLVYARGFGWADEGGRRPIEPTSVFRLASISKSLTGIGILKLVQENKLCLQQKVFARPGEKGSGEGPCGNPILDLRGVRCRGCKVDPRIYDITVQDLMQMAGGWITSTEKKEYCGVMTKGTGDYGFEVPGTRQALHLDRMPTRAEVIRHGISQPLNYTPGSCFYYANFNFMVLGQVIEQVTGEPYERWMQENILRPMGAMHANVLEYRRTLANEVDYYTVGPGGENKRCCLDLPPEIDSFGGWTASIVDLAHVQASLRNGIPEPNPLNAASMASMVSRPANPHFAGKFAYWTDGWDTVWCAAPSGGTDGCAVKDAGWEKGGDFGVGTITHYASNSDGVGVVILFNSHTPTNMQDINQKLVRPLLATKKDWPVWDLFGEY